MGPYIYGKRNAIHIVDIRETVRGLLLGQKFISQLVAKGQDVLFVGTKRQARESIKSNADRCGMPYVTERWLGGTLTNFRTIRSRLQRLEELEGLMTSSEWESGYSKKMKSMLSRELRKIQRNLGGIRIMNRLPGALVIVDVRKEHNAVREAQSLGLPTVALIDTDSDPAAASIPIPGNDDSMRAIDLVVGRLADAVEEGKRNRPAKVDPTPGEGREGGQRRRGGRGPEAAVGSAPSPAPAAAAAPTAPAPVAEAAPAETPAAPAAEPTGDTGGQSGDAPAAN